MQIINHKSIMRNARLEEIENRINSVGGNNLENAVDFILIEVKKT